MDALQDLYQELILDHSRAPHNFGHLDDANCTACGHNPLCGDQLVLELKLENGVIDDAKFSGMGCAISTASASMMTDMVKGKSEEDARKLFACFHAMLTEEGEVDTDALEKLVSLAGVRNFPARVKCATLAWHTLDAALDNKKEATTE